ncbi:MAG: tRNA (adenosine(37)-N6)-threonylcarbamoyltransferase complex ATPase subunit type 1 TsaE [Ruminococcus sp.]|nr:tRNA (adenosine(37)-N6)-threonylcarbamoyltransferase complex ATPase subunit type 1 TsaE [Ruminococcus sp.]
MIKTIITNSPEETIKAAEEIGKLLRAGDIIAYHGGLGAGKTTFTRGLALGLGLGDVVSSPTFALVNEYNGKTLSLYHFDMYRIVSEWDLESSGFYDYDFSSNIAAVEWSENIEKYLMGNRINITINALDEQKREITLEGDERFAAAWN